MFLVGLIMRLSTTLSFYIMRQFLLFMVMVMTLVMGMVVLFDVIELIRRAPDRADVGIFTFIGMSLLKAPQLLHVLLPFGVMIGAVVTFWAMTRSRELVVVRAAGISAWQFLAPVLVAVFVIGILEITVVNPVSAQMFARFKAMEADVLANRSSVLDLSETGLWLREGDEKQQTVLYAEKVRQDGDVLDLNNVEVFMFEGKNDLRYSLLADSGTLENGAISLKNVLWLEAGRASERLSRLDLDTALTLELVQDNFSQPEVLSFWQLPGFISFFERAGFATIRHRMYFQSLLASPFLLCGMVLLAAPFSLRPNMRSGGVLLRLGGVVVAGFALYFFSRLVYALGQTSTLPELLATWSPAAVALALGAVGLLHLEDG